MPETTGAGEKVTTTLRTRAGVTVTQAADVNELGWLTPEEQGIVRCAPAGFNQLALAVNLLNAREVSGGKEALIAEIEAFRYAEDHPAPTPLAPAPRDIAGF